MAKKTRKNGSPVLRGIDKAIAKRGITKSMTASLVSAYDASTQGGVRLAATFHHRLAEVAVADAYIDYDQSDVVDGPPSLKGCKVLAGWLDDVCPRIRLGADLRDERSPWRAEHVQGCLRAHSWAVRLLGRPTGLAIVDVEKPIRAPKAYGIGGSVARLTRLHSALSRRNGPLLADGLTVLTREEARKRQDKGDGSVAKRKVSAKTIRAATLKRIALVAQTALEHQFLGAQWARRELNRALNAQAQKQGAQSAVDLEAGESATKVRVPKAPKRTRKVRKVRKVRKAG